MKIGVFDSGIGGQAVANRLSELLPSADILCVDDHKNVPYGDRSDTDIIQLTEAAIQPLITEQCDAIVIACNTATMVAIAHLRAQYPAINFVGIEPMVKPAAAQTTTGTIAVLATPATFRSAAYARLKDSWARDITIIEPDTSTWAGLIESGDTDQVPIEQMTHELIQSGADVIVLACTHYHWLCTRAEEATGTRASVLEPSDAIGKRIIDLINA